MRTSGIYTIENRVTGHVYVGSSVHVEARLRKHRGELNCGRHANRYLQNSWRKHGQDAFRFAILEECEPAILLALEQYWINQIDPVFNLVRTPIRGGLAGLKHSEETRKKISIRAKGRKYNQAFRDACRKRMLGKGLSKEARKKAVRSRKDVRPVICVESGLVYESAAEAGRQLHLDPSCILKCCKGKLPHVKRTTWAYVTYLSQGAVPSAA